MVNLCRLLNNKPGDRGNLKRKKVIKKNKLSVLRRTKKRKKIVSASSSDINPKRNPAAKQTPLAALGLKKIPAVGYNFDDVIDNVEKLLDFYFPDSSKGIRGKVFHLSCKYAEDIDGDYEDFTTLHNSKRELQRWSLTVVPEVELKSRLQLDILDLYYQINMVKSYDVYDDTLIYAYLEDIQPKLK
jgi:hypothetical protein